MIKPLVFWLGVSLHTLAAAQSAAKPVYKIGDSWEWINSATLTKLQTGKTRLEVVEVGENIKLRSADEASATVVWDETGRFLSNQKSGTSFTYLTPAQWPLEVGKKSTREYTWTNQYGSKGKTTEDVEVLAYEDVTTPAGTFKAFKIQFSGYFTNFSRNSNGPQKRTLWYVPELKVPVKSMYEDTFDKTTSELSSFKVK
jgi:hypothetical protein